MRSNVERESQPNPVLGDLIIFDFDALVDHFDSCDAAQGTVRTGEHSLCRVLETRRARSNDFADLAYPQGSRLPAASSIQASLTCKLARAIATAPAGCIPLVGLAWHTVPNEGPA